MQRSIRWEGAIKAFFSYVEDEWECALEHGMPNLPLLLQEWPIDFPRSSQTCSSIRSLTAGVKVIGG
jgi:hypothetical protein